jgi:triosephosphate isomerase
VQTKEGYVPPIHDFLLTTAEGDDITEELLADSGYVMLLVSPHLEKADDSRLDLINELYEYASDHGYPFYGLTASGEQAIQRWRDRTGAEYPFCQADEITLKTIVRSNPGLVLLRQGTVVGKWSHNRLPQLSEEQDALPLERLEMGQMPNDSVPRKIAALLLWFVLPLSLLTIADRTWMWTKWLRRKKAVRKSE